VHDVDRVIEPLYYLPNREEDGVSCSTTSFSNTTVDCKGDIDYAFDK
jgi:hypothetical protein